MELQTILWIAVVVAFVAFAGWFLSPIFVYARSKGSEDAPSELEFLTGVEGSVEPFPSLDDLASRTLSVVVPAYEEEERLTPMLEDTLRVLRELTAERGESFTWEIIVVDDGSRDGTAGVVLKFTRREGADAVRLCRLARNHGKGGAVRKGMLRARGELLLMADADGATDASEIVRILDRMQLTSRRGHGIVVGSRAHMEESSKASRTPLRTFLMVGFHTFLSIFAGGHGIRDTQCGFKLFTRETARLIFPVQHIERWAFDPELLYLATLNNVPIDEMPVKWHEVDGSKIDIITASFQMARDIVLIRICYALGIWR